jgi:hypothetical protein
LTEVLREQEKRDPATDEYNADGKKPFLDQFIISDENALYKYWMIFMSMFCLVSGFKCLYNTAFQNFYTANNDNSEVTNIAVDIFLDFVFLIDMVLMFFHEFSTEERYQPVRDFA